MPTPTPELGLQKAVDADDTADYLDTSLANSLTTVDSLFNNVSGHTHGGVHQGGPISSIPISAIPDGSITSAKITDGTVQSVDMATGAAAGNVGTLGGALTGTLPNPQIASGATLTSPAIAGTITGTPSWASGPYSGDWFRNTVHGQGLFNTVDGTGVGFDGIGAMPYGGSYAGTGHFVTESAPQTLTNKTILTPSGDAPVSGTGSTPLRIESGTATSPGMASGSGLDVPVIFQRAFNAPPRVIVGLATSAGQDIASKFAGIEPNTLTVSGFSWRAFYQGGGTGSVSMSWIAIGS